MYTIDDIQIFITTHNRANYIKDSIESILHQTANVNEIIVLDNESTDNTEEIVKSYALRGVKYVKTYGFLGNFKKAKEIVNKPYCMLFHDDDILHPDYLKNAINVLNKHKNIALITTKYTEFNDNDIPTKFEKITNEYYLFKKQLYFVARMFFIEYIAYAPTIYYSKYFFNTSLEYEKFNKFNDWPFMAKISKYGNSILFNNPNMYHVRRHRQQDTWTNTNIPSFEQIINWDKYFYDILKTSPLFLEMYKFKSEYFLKNKYQTFIPSELKSKFTYQDLLSLANEKGLNNICQDRLYKQKMENEYYYFYNRLSRKFLHKSLIKRILSRI